ncbi:hypothetical protein KFE25_004055 [Diacronema lutheri]|uniref:WSC domain-containing protein n=1 Tax=Diacronema lutheri TaxID=2081491 RepID=A0A8J5XGZ3_DIALT|nr:hypothetical protein KFE25_004055 [Diacronema lutheri]
MMLTLLLANVQPVAAFGRSGVCDHMSMQDLQTFVVGAYAQLKVINEIPNDLARGIAQRGVCTSLLNRDDSPAKCLTEAVVNKTVGACRAIKGCPAESGFRGAIDKLCGFAGGLACKPPMCASSDDLDGVMAGCFDVRRADSNGAIVRAQFSPVVLEDATAVGCASECAGSANFVLEDGDCSCGRHAFDLAGAAEYKVKAKDCGRSCRQEPDVHRELPCGRSKRLAVYETAEVAKLSRALRGHALRAEGAITMAWRSDTLPRASALGAGCLLLAMAALATAFRSRGARAAEGSRTSAAAGTWRERANRLV